VLANNEIHAVARPLLERLAAETQSVVGLAIRDGLNMIYLESAKGQSAVRRDSSVGYRVPICGSAMGWACLASLRPGEREAVLEQVRRQMPAAEWNALQRKVQRALGDVWKKGFCISYGDIDPVVNAVGVPFLHRSAMGAYALNCVSPAYLFTAQKMETEIGPRLIRLAEELHGSLSFGAAPAAVSGSSG
jgi:DNA-binding IclR family transcriptional regulator